MKLPLLLINFKHSPKALGIKALRLAKLCEQVSAHSSASLIVAPATPDLAWIASQVKRVLVFAQHADGVEGDEYTGHVLMRSLRASRVKGVLLNHSEHELGRKELARCIQLAKQFKLFTVCCIPNLKAAKRALKLEPDSIAYEAPELIGSGMAISKQKPESVRKFVRLVGKHTIPLCGAGISSVADVRAALELGVKGVLVSSAIVKARAPTRVLRSFVRCMQ